MRWCMWPRGEAWKRELLSYFGCCWCQERRCLGVFPSRGSSCPYSFPCGLPSGLCMCAQHGQWAVFQMGWPRHMTDWAGVKRWRGPPFTASVYYFSWTCSQSVVAGSCEWGTDASMLRPRELMLGFTRTSQWLDSGLLDSQVKLRNPWGPWPAGRPGEPWGSNATS